mgnify:CR=1 FL=1
MTFGEVDAAWAALEAGDPRGALAHLDALVKKEIRSPHSGPVAALAWLDLGEPTRAEAALARAREELDPNDPDLLWALGECALAGWRLVDAERAYRAVHACDPEFAPACERLALLCDLAGREAEADRWQSVAAELNPETFPEPHHLTPAAFEKVVARAALDLPPPFQAGLAAIPVLIDPVPRAELAARAPYDTPAGALGLFVGASQLERSVESSGEAPAAIYLFQRNLERASFDPAELEHEIRVTLYHELAHALGFDEDGVDAMGLG